MIDLTQPAPKIAEELTELFWDIPFAEFDMTNEEHGRDCAIKAIEIALQFCPKEYLQSFHDPYFKENFDYTKLTEVLRILKEK